MLVSRFLRNVSNRSIFYNLNTDSIDKDAVNASAKYNFRYRFISKWLNISIEEARSLTFDEILVATKEAKMIREQSFQDNKIAMQNAMVTVIQQLFGKGDKNGQQ